MYVIVIKLEGTKEPVKLAMQIGLTKTLIKVIPRVSLKYCLMFLRFRVV